MVKMLNLNKIIKSRIEDKNTIYTDEYLTNVILLKTKNFLIGHCLCDMEHDLQKETLYFIGIDDENNKEQDETKQLNIYNIGKTSHIL